MLNLLGTNKMNMRIHPTGCHDAPFRCNHLSGSPNRHGNPILNQRVSRMPDPNDPAIFNPDIGFDYSLDRIQNQGVCNHQIQRLGIQCGWRLPHAITDHFSTAKLHFISIAAILCNQIAFDLN